MAVPFAETWIDTRHAAMRPHSDPGLPEVRILDPDEAVAELPVLHDRWRRGRAGDVSRNAPTWRDTWVDPPGRRGGMSAWYHVASDRAYASFRTAEAEPGQAERGQGEGRVRVQALYGADDDAEAAMFRWLTTFDLVGRLELASRPVDDPIRWRLADPRRLATTCVGDMLWVRVLDTAAALTARSYAGTGRLVLDVVGGADPAVGRWVLDAGPDGASCERAGAAARSDVRLGLEELGALYMGGVGAATLAAAGRIDEEVPGALAVADRLFPTSRAPFCGTGF